MTRPHGSPTGPAKGPIHVLAGQDGKQLFEQFRDPRVRVYRAGEGSDLPPGLIPDLVIVPCLTSLLLELTDPGVPDQVWAAAAAGRTGVVFDASAEGRVHTPQRTEVLHGFLRAHGVSPASAVYLTQERRYGGDYLAHCASAGLGQSMSVILHDYWIWRFFAQFEDRGDELFEERLQAFRDRPAARRRRFISLNFTPRPTKVLFLLSLIRDGMWDQGFISFGGFDQFQRDTGQDRAAFRRSMGRLEGFEDMAAELTPRLAELDAYGQVMLGKVRREAGARYVSRAPLRDPNMGEFQQSFFTVITETEMRGWASRITEKPLKPLVNFHPLITFGNPGALRMIRDLGFATFPEVIDESYDAEPDPRRRFDMVYAEVRRLCALDDAEMARLEASISDKLEANARRGLLDLSRAGRTVTDTALIDQILTAVRL